MNFNDYNSDFYNFFSKIANSQNCTIKALSNNHILEIFDVKNQKKFYIVGHSLPLNDNCSQKICQDKVALYDVLKSNNIPAIEHILLKNPNLINHNQLKIAKQYLKSNKNIVVKDNQGFSGQLVYKTQNYKSTKRHIKEIFKLNKDVTLSPFINFNDEYRLVMYRNRCEICFKKIRPFVVGDGKSSLKNLILKKFGKNFDWQLLQKKKNVIPRENEIVNVGWKHNLKHFSTPINIEKSDLRFKLETLAKKATKLLNLKFCSVDIVDKNGTFEILEINSTVSFLRYAIHNLQNNTKVENLFKKIFKDILKINSEDKK